MSRHLVLLKALHPGQDIRPQYVVRLDKDAQLAVGADGVTYVVEIPENLAVLGDKPLRLRLKRDPLIKEQAE